MNRNIACFELTLHCLCFELNQIVFDEIIVELKFVAQDYADLYANQKTEYLDYNNLSFTVFVGKAARLVDRSGLPYVDKLIFIEKIKKISGNFTEIQNDYAASLQEKRLRAA